MGVETKIFDYSRPFPKPFDTMKGKKVKVQSVYGENTEATLCAAVIKAINAVCGCREGTMEGAVGIIDHKSVAEYKSSITDEYHIVVYDPNKGTILASVYNNNTETIEQYTVHKSARDGTAIFMAMFPILMADKEFSDCFEVYYDEYISKFPDMKKATDAMGVLCDNVYRRVKDIACSAHVNVNVDSTGNMTRISTTHLDAGTYKPNTVVAGDFTIFSASAGVTVAKPAKPADVNDFIAKYSFDTSRTLSAYEESLVPVVESWYILPEEIITLCKHAHLSTSKTTPMRNFELRGPAGTGKTAGVRAFAAGVHLPYMKYTCSANTEIYDLIGQVFPNLVLQSTGDPDLDRELEELRRMGGVSYGNVAKLLNMPNLDDMEYEPASTYAAITGVTKPDASIGDCISAVLHTVTEKIKDYCTASSEDNSSGQSFTYTETDLIKALKYGYVVEIQEPNVIMQPGVLVGLNSLLEHHGSITLPTGEIVNRHPDAVVIQTTNLDYEGCRNRNQSVQDRMSLVVYLDLPPTETMVQRAMSVTGCDDDVMVSRMVQVINDMADYCHKTGITDGTCGMRSLLDWIVSTEITEDPYTSAIYTVVNKAASSEEDRTSLITSVLEPIFAPKRKRRSA